MVKHFGYEDMYADHYAKRRESDARNEMVKHGGYGAKATRSPPKLAADKGVVRPMATVLQDEGEQQMDFHAI